MDPQPITLTNEFVTLEPMSLSHCADLTEAIDKDVFKYMPMRSAVITPNQVRRYIEFHIKRPNTVSFTVIDNRTSKAIGSTSYINIQRDHYGLEIGSTWITKAARGTKINPSMKLLMLQHAFEELNAIRVVLCTDNRNEHSKAAILKLGAKPEGIIRNHIIMPDEHFRDSALFSIIPTQWHQVRDGLINRLNAEH